MTQDKFYKSEETIDRLYNILRTKTNNNSSANIWYEGSENKLYISKAGFTLDSLTNLFEFIKLKGISSLDISSCRIESCFEKFGFEWNLENVFKKDLGLQEVSLSNNSGIYLSHIASLISNNPLKTLTLRDEFELESGDKLLSSLKNNDTLRSINLGNCIISNDSTWQQILEVVRANDKLISFDLPQPTQPEALSLYQTVRDELENHNQGIIALAKKLVIDYAESHTTEASHDQPIAADMASTYKPITLLRFYNPSKTSSLQSYLAKFCLKTGVSQDAISAIMDEAGRIATSANLFQLLGVTKAPEGDHSTIVLNGAISSKILEFLTHTDINYAKDGSCLDSINTPLAGAAADSEASE